MIFNLPYHKWMTLLSSVAFLVLIFSPALAQQSESESDTSPSVKASYRIVSGDKLSVKFLYHPELNEPSIVVRPDGFITLSIVDEVMARGLTVAELKASIEKAYSETLLKPMTAEAVVSGQSNRIISPSVITRSITTPGTLHMQRAILEPFRVGIMMIRRGIESSSPVIKFTTIEAMFHGCVLVR